MLLPYSHHCSIQSSFTALNPPGLHLFIPLPDLQVTTDLFAIYSLPFPECHAAGIIQYVAFSDWLYVLSRVYLRFIRFVFVRVA